MPGLSTIEQEPATLRDEILKPIFFDESDLKDERDCSPEKVFRDRRVQQLLGPEHQIGYALMLEVLQGNKALEPEQIRLAAETFEIALLRWHKKIARLEKRIAHSERTGKEKPFDTEDLARVIKHAAKTFYDRLRENYSFRCV